MPIQITCPSCSRQLRVPDDLVGKYVKCPGCDKTFTATVEGNSPLTESFREEPAAKPEPARLDEPPTRPRRPPREDEDFDDDRPRRRNGRDLAPHRGQLILILGILSLFVGGIFTAIPAWIMGNHDLKEMREGRMDPEGESNTNVGRIIGMVVTILNLVFCVCGGGCWLMMMIGAAAGGGK